MAPAVQEGSNVTKLRKLYKNDPSIAKVCDDLAAREKVYREWPVERMCQRTGLSRADVIEVFRTFESLNFGRFLVGRRGQQSRFYADVSMVSVGKAATGETAEVATDEIEEGDEESATGGNIEHSFRLRADLTVEFSLPANLTTAEAARLADFIRALPFTT